MIFVKENKLFVKGSIHMIESIIASFLLLFVFIFMFKSNNFNQKERWQDYSNSILRSNFQSLSENDSIIVIRHITNDNFVINISKFEYVYSIYNGKIYTVYPIEDNSLVKLRKINSSFYQVYFLCDGECEYDVLYAHKDIKDWKPLDIVFYDNTTAFMVIQ